MALSCLRPGHGRAAVWAEIPCHNGLNSIHTEGIDSLSERTGLAHARFCTHCGTSLTNARRELPCARCYNNNPLGTRVLVSSCVMQGDGLLWIRRALEPRRGFWAIPGGFLECGETLTRAACREVLEETGLELDERSLRLHGFGSVKHMNQVYVVYRTEVGEVTLRPGEEALEARFFRE